MKLLHTYELASGQLVSAQKSVLVAGKHLTRQRLQKIVEVTGFKSASLPLTYLGCPLFKGRKKKILYDDLLSKIRSKLRGWDKATISQGGRLTLIKSVLAAMPIYLLQVLKPPASIIRQVEKIFARFFWGSTETVRKLHWTKWINVCLPVEEGGLGVRKLEDVVMAFSFKLWWRFRSQNSLWANFLQHKYCQGSFPASTRVSIHHSSSWLRLCAVRSNVEPHLFWEIGQENLFFWHDCWMGDSTLATRFSQGLHTDVKVSHFLHAGAWDLMKLEEALPPQLVEQVLQVPIAAKDQLVWRLTADGDFSTKSAWNELRYANTIRSIYSEGWNKWLTPTISIFFWKLLNGWIPVDERLQKKGIQLASKCQCCDSCESLGHVLFSSQVAASIWNHFAHIFQVKLPNSVNFHIVFQSWKFSSAFVSEGHIRVIIPILICWFLWVERTNSKHRGMPFHGFHVVWQITQYISHLKLAGILRQEQFKGDWSFATMFGISKPSFSRNFRLVSWVKPSPQWVKLNTDGCSKGNPRRAGFGGLVRDHKGAVLVAFHGHIQRATNTEAELQGILHGLLICRDYGFQQVWIEVDAKAVISLIYTGSGGHWQCRNTIRRIQDLLHTMDTRISHIYREGNSAADILANLGCSTRSYRSWEPPNIPLQIRGAIRCERMSLPYLRVR